MIRYTVYFNGEQTNVYELDEPVVFIGRLPENQIPITNMGISRRHVKIELDPGGGYTLSDLNSLNGTLVNGKRTKKTVLSHGDKITIGKYTIIYEDLRETSPFLDTMVAEISPEELRNMAAATGHPLPVHAGGQPLVPNLSAAEPPAARAVLPHCRLPYRRQPRVHRLAHSPPPQTDRTGLCSLRSQATSYTNSTAVS